LEVSSGTKAKFAEEKRMVADYFLALVAVHRTVYQSFFICMIDDLLF